MNPPRRDPDNPPSVSMGIIIKMYFLSTPPDPSDPFSVFVTPRGIHDFKEGEDYLFRCLLTDPSVTNLTLQSVGKVGGRGRGLPQGMNVTFDPRRGALIHQLQQAFNGRYVCSGWRNGSEFLSKPIDLWLYPSKTRLTSDRFLLTRVSSYATTSSPICPPMQPPPHPSVHLRDLLLTCPSLHRC